MNSHQRLTEIHLIKAREKALRLFACTSSVIPGEWSSVWNEMIVPDLLEFAFHARKVNEFCKLMNSTFPSIDVKLVTITSGDPGMWESNYIHALNAVMHMQGFSIGQAHADHRKIFINYEANLITTYIKVSTDKFPEEKTISIYGLVECFLFYVIPKVKDKNPNLRF
ncbi:hypothetical protein [Cellvibrio sp. PSBB023]|uniref:hypothetical protein n=1 Tax=Cellvibrio sp. PSBB023 TaxID=1945512 RepID=UPI00098F21E3|nr:hypothetical protein [Cellvibrio sp. PSBB023]AQT59009.1 hypothetical protein B0D95_02070 [Cellvibrio sp. PSBB023]